MTHDARPIRLNKKEEKWQNNKGFTNILILKICINPVESIVFIGILLSFRNIKKIVINTKNNYINTWIWDVTLLLRSNYG